MTGDMTANASTIAISDAGPMILATVPLPGCSPEQALAAFTDPAVLRRWWRGELKANLVPGGEYSVSFPAIPARLAGQVVSYQPGQSLEFSWAWDGDDGPPSTVRITVEGHRSERGTMLRIEHGPHGTDEAGLTAHKEHWAGWEYFLPGLAAALAG